MELLTWLPLLSLAVLLPFFWIVVRRSLVDRPKASLRAAAACRLLAVLLLVLALCRPFLTRKTDDLHVAFLLDASESVDPAAMKRGIDDIERSVATLQSGDTWSLHLFAKRPRALSIAQARAFAEECEAGRGDAEFRSATDLDGALAAIRFSLPAAKARRIVVLSDGVLERPLAESARRLAAEKTSLVFAKIGSLERPEAAVTSIQSGTPVAFQGELVRFTIHSLANRDMNARLRLTHRGVAVAEQPIRLLAGTPTRSTLEVRMVTSGDTVWEAELLPEEDHFPANNRLSTTLPVRGKPRILAIHAKPAQMRPVERLLRQQEMELETRGERGLPESLEELLSFDAIWLAEVPATSLSPRQMNALKSYVTDFGGGLFMSGSENSFGLGGYLHTPVEEVLPLVSRFEKEKEKPSLAMVLVIDKSGSMQGAPMALARQAARSAAELLGNQDQIAVIAFDHQPQLVIDLTPASNRAQIAAAIDSIAEAGGTDLQPAMLQAREILRTASAKIKHVIALTDGQTPPSNLVELCQDLSSEGATVSTVAMGQSASRQLLAAMAEAGRGRYYETDSPENVPQIFTRETMQASRSAIKEDLYEPAPVSEHPIMAGFESSSFPPVLGYVMTRAKPTTQVLLAVESGDPLLAIGRFGLGSGLAFTADFTERWGGEWLAWPGGGKFLAQLLRGILRKEESSGIETHATATADGWDIALRASDEAGNPLAAVPWIARALDQAGEEYPVSIQETGVGRYQLHTDPRAAERLTLLLQDPQRGTSRTLRWEKGYPHEYQLHGTVDPTLASAPAFDPATLRQGLDEVRVRRSAIPLLGLLSIVCLITGIVLRRI